MNKKIILVVDDSASIRGLVAAVLSEEGYQIVEAADGIEGLERLEELSDRMDDIGLIFADVNMPRMDGIQMIRTIKQGEFRHIPVLVLTTESSIGKKMKGKDAGAAGWLVKPFNDKQLKGVVARFLQ